MKKIFFTMTLFLLLTAGVCFGQEQIKAVVLKSAGGKNKMKKWCIIFVLLIISIPALAHEKSTLIKDFSLVKHPGDNIREAFKIDIFSERTSLSLIDAAEYTDLIWAIRYNLLCGQNQEIDSEIKSKSLAEGYLKQLAERSRKARKISGVIGVALGGVWLATSTYVLSLEELGWEEALGGKGFWTFLLVAPGIGFVVAGVSTLVTPSRAGKELDYVLSISAPSLRERAGYEALSSLSARGKKRRILRGIVCSICSFMFFAGSEDTNLPLPVLGAASGAGAVYFFTSKSPEEKAFQKYLKERLQQIGSVR
jgi:hypothetical protein